MLADPNSNGTGLYAPAIWMGVSDDGATPTGGESTLAGEVTDGSLVRAQGTLVHTAGAPFYAVSRTVVSDRSITIRKYGLFTAQTGGVLVWVNLLNQPAVLVSGDQIPLTVTVTIS